MMLRHLLILAIATTALMHNATADDKPVDGKTSEADFSFFGKKQDPDSLIKIKKSRVSVAELRQARALLKADQRRARIERNAWMRHEPLRPNFHAVPSMRSRYEQRTFYIPVYWYR